MNVKDRANKFFIINLLLFLGVNCVNGENNILKIYETKISSNYEKIVFRGVSYKESVINLYICHPARKEIQQIGKRVLGFSISSNGENIAFSGGESLNSIKIWNSEKKILNEVKNEKNEEKLIYLDPKFSPVNPYLIAFERQRFTKNYWEEGLFIYNLNTKIMERITDEYLLKNGKQRHLFCHGGWEWSFNGEYIYYTTEFPIKGAWKVRLKNNEKILLSSEIFPSRYYPSPFSNLCVFRVEENLDYESVYLYNPENLKSISLILKNISGLEDILWKCENSIILLVKNNEKVWSVEEVNLITGKRRKIFNSDKKIKLVDIKNDNLILVEDEKRIVNINIKTLDKIQIFPFF